MEQPLPQQTVLLTGMCNTSGVLGFDFAKTREAELNIMTSNWTVRRNKSWYKILLLNVKYLEKLVDLPLRDLKYFLIWFIPSSVNGYFLFSRLNCQKRSIQFVCTRAVHKETELLK
jgi:hypothetical protein